MPGREIQFLPTSVRRAVGSVYHYTSAAGLMAMVQAGTAWASESSSLNDIAEVRQGWDAVAAVLAAEPHSDGVELLAALANEPLKAKHEVFVLCASTAGDDANQWRLYADGGRGYAVELDGTQQLAAVSSRVRKPKVTRGTTRVRATTLTDGATVTPWLHVIYDTAEVATVVGELIATVDSEIDYLQTVPESDTDIVADGIRDSAHEALATIAHLIKSPGFVGENEVRVVATFDFGAAHVEYRVGSLGVVGFANLTQSPDGRGGAVLRPEPSAPVPTTLPVRSVRLGPLHRREHINTISGLVRRFDDGRHVMVTRSAVPFR